MSDSPLALALRLARRLDDAHQSYAIGGALALGIHGQLRATRDVDLNVFVTPEGVERLIELFDEVGVTVDKRSALQQAATEGIFSGWSEETRVDVFLPSIDLSWEAERTKVLLSIEGQQVWFLSSELLCVFKLLFFRPKDLVDLEALLRANHQVALSQVRGLIAAAMGEDDVRVVEWDRIVSRVRPTSGS